MTGVILIGAIDEMPIRCASLSDAHKWAADTENWPRSCFEEFREFRCLRAEKDYELFRGSIEEVLAEAQTYCELSIPIMISPVRYWNEENKSAMMDGNFRITATVYHPVFEYSREWEDQVSEEARLKRQMISGFRQ